MKKICLFLLILGVFSLSAEVIYEPGLENKVPEIMAQGGSFHAVAEGYGALFTNPAGFSSEKGELTLLSIDMGLTADIFGYLEQDYAMSTDSGDILSAISDQIGNGLGLSLAPSIAWVGKGWGFGILPEANILVEGSSILSPSGALRSTIAGVAGYAHSFDLGVVKIDLGGDVRPMYRAYVDADNMVENLISSLNEDSADNPDMFSNLDGIVGTAVGFDAGTKVHFGPLIGSLTLRDIGGTVFDYYYKSSEEFADNDFLPSGNSAVEDTYVTPMSLVIGAAFDPDIPVFDPKFHAQYTRAFGYDGQDAEAQSLLSSIQIGAEMEVFGFIRPRLGLNAGYLSAGLGLDFFLFEINAAIYGEESGERAGQDAQMGASLELAIRI